MQNKEESREVKSNFNGKILVSDSVIPYSDSNRDKENKQSEAYFSADGTSIQPKIMIKSNTIRVEHKEGEERRGDATLNYTQLQGSGGNFFFRNPGVYRITPGTYDHYVWGTCLGRSSRTFLSSKVHYS